MSGCEYNNEWWWAVFPCVSIFFIGFYITGEYIMIRKGAFSHFDTRRRLIAIMNEEDLHLAKVLVGMDLENTDSSIKKSVVGKVKERVFSSHVLDDSNIGSLRVPDAKEVRSRCWKRRKEKLGRKMGSSPESGISLEEMIRQRRSLDEDLDNLDLESLITMWRTRSLNAPSPIQQFGPCGRIMKNSAMVMTIQDPASQRLTWYKPPLTVLVIKKVRDVSVLQPFVQLVRWLTEEKRMVVFVENSVMDDSLLVNNTGFLSIKDKLMTFRDGKDDLTDKIDFIICLGGDGTLLYASLLFQQSVPPVMAFHLGSLGFLTPFEFDNFQEQVTNVLEGHAALTLRSRLRCIIMRKNEESKAPTNLLVLNEVVIDRGPSPYLSNIDLFLDGKHITSVQGDGLIVSTPTGSTAYAVAAGASMIHPSVPAIMVTPICPHSLSFRPIVVPAGVELKISVSPDSRNTSWVSFDGRNRQELFHGDSLRVTTSIYPVPSICSQDQISDWFDSLAECLHWNVRKRQKHLDELSDLTHSSSNDTLDSLEHTEQLDS